MINYSNLHQSWLSELNNEFAKPYMLQLDTFLNERKNSGAVIYPEAKNIFRALELSSLQDVKVVILGQDPYHGPDQAHGLSFSVQENITKLPPSLRNIYKELIDDVECDMPANGFLEPWAKQGVLLLNAVLTVEESNANCHAKKGWEHFTDSVIKTVSDKKENVVFILWGAYAQKKQELINESKHYVITSAHPSPLSARRGFFGSKPFSKTNDYLKQNNIEQINWSL